MSWPEGDRKHQMDSLDIIKGNPDISHLEVANDGLISELNSLGIRESVIRFKRASLYCTLAAFSALCDGYQINLTGSIIANKGFIRQFGSVSDGGVYKLATNHVAAWGGIQSAGQVLGMLTLHFFSDFAGRKMALLLLTVILASSVVAETVATTWWHWLLAKLFAGVGVGMLQSTVPVYIIEISPAQIRGALVNAYSLWFVFGQFLAPLVLQRMNADEPFNFRVPIYTEWVMIGCMAIFFLVLPETPWWLIGKGKIDRARKTMQHIYGDVPGYDVEHELRIIENVIKEEYEAAAALKIEYPWEFLRGVNLRRTLIACWPKCMQQLTGLTLVNTYATYFFQLAGNKDPFKVTVILVVIQILSVILVSCFSDSYGRRTITVYGFLIAAVSVLCIGIIGCFDYQSSSIGSLLIFFAALVMFFNTGAGALGYAYLAEVPAQKWRARTAGFGAAVAASFGTCFSTSVPYMLNTDPGVGWGVKTGFFFGATGLLSVLLAFFILPETARRTPAEIDEMFEKHLPCRRFAGYVTDAQRTASGGDT